HSYLYRAVAVNSSGSIGGTEATVTMQPPAPSAPGAPQFSNVTATGVRVTAPSLPQYATELTLQQRYDWQWEETDWVDVATNLAGGAVTDVTNLTPDTGYSFRYVAHGVSGDTGG